MPIIDLTQPIYSGMPVFPGDPEVEVEQVFTLEKDGWNMARLHINTHDGTHINVLGHGVKDGKKLDEFELADFIGEAVLYESDEDIEPGIGVIFSKVNIDKRIAQIIAKQKPKFIGLSDKFDFDLDVEKYLLEKEIVSYEKLANTEKLPKSFIFYGIPLPIKDGDGSPVRAFALVD